MTVLFTRVRVFIFFTVLVFFSGKTFAANDFKNAARELRERRNFNNMDSYIKEYLEDREEYLQIGIARKNINPKEEKKIRRSLERIRLMWKKVRENASLTASTKKSIDKELANCYRMIWFYSRKDDLFVYTYQGEKYFLKEPWQSRFMRTTLSSKDMEGILKTVNKVWRLRSRIDKTGNKIPEEELQEIRAQIKALLLEEYFSLEKPETNTGKRENRAGKSKNLQKTTKNPEPKPTIKSDNKSNNKKTSTGIKQ